LNEIRAAPSIKSKEIVTPTSDKLFMLYHICKKKMDLWHKTIQKDHYHWVPKGEDPLDTKWSQKRRIPNFGNWFSEGKILKFFQVHRLSLESDCN